jgi:hypothetical protein
LWQISWIGIEQRRLIFWIAYCIVKNKSIIDKTIVLQKKSSGFYQIWVVNCKPSTICNRRTDLFTSDHAISLKTKINKLINNLRTINRKYIMNSSTHHLIIMFTTVYCNNASNWNVRRSLPCIINKKKKIVLGCRMWKRRNKMKKVMC